MSLRPTSYHNPPSIPSLREVHRSIKVPADVSFWRKVIAFSVPGFLVAVGYMDPGNWAAALAGGLRFAYQSVFVLMMSNLMAVLLQTVAGRLGIVTPRDLAQACRDHDSRRVSLFLWGGWEIA